jgi:hypothetical protein
VPFGPVPFVPFPVPADIIFVSQLKAPPEELRATGAWVDAYGLNRNWDWHHTVIAFYGRNKSSRTDEEIAITVAHELGHGVGLEHFIGNVANLMTSGGDGRTGVDLNEAQANAYETGAN